VTDRSTPPEHSQAGVGRSSNRFYCLAAGLVLVCGFLLFIGIFGAGIFRILTASPISTPDFATTLQALINSDTPGPVAPSPTLSPPTGHIVLTCQIFKYQSSEQICLMNADGSDYYRLTKDDNIRHFYPSLAPDGQSVVYSAFNPLTQHFDIYELNLITGLTKALTNAFGDLNGPEISPDLKTIVFARYFNDINHPTIWLMDRDGNNFRQVSNLSAWDPTWSPDGKQILFASDRDGSDQLYIVNLDGSNLRKVSNLPALRGRSDWSAKDLIVTYSGDPWKRELYIMNPDGSNQHQISPRGGNSQGPSFSPDGQWIVFTAYFDKFNDINGCEIYIMRIDGTSLHRLTNNDYCDYQPRWGP
jgi:TolB protein